MPNSTSPNIIGAPNVYQPIEWVTASVADQSEIPAATKEMAESGYFPLQMAFGRIESPIAIKPTWYVIGWRITPVEAPKVTL